MPSVTLDDVATWSTELPDVQMNSESLDRTTWSAAGTAFTEIEWATSDDETRVWFLTVDHKSALDALSDSTITFTHPEGDDARGIWVLASDLESADRDEVQCLVLESWMAAVQANALVAA